MNLTSSILDINHSLVAIYRNQLSTNSFYVGKISAFNSYHAAISLVSPEGKPDGVCVCTLNSIYRIELFSNYLNSLEVAIPDLYTFSSEILEDILTYAQNNQYVTDFRDNTNKRIMFGIPISCSGDYVTVQRVRCNGTLGAVYKINKHHISLVECNSETEQQLQQNLRR